MNNSNEIKKTIYDQTFKPFKRCLWPEGCSEKPINAHSIQNSRFLDILAKDGHVIMLKAPSFLDTGFKISFEPESKNRATTFTGLCKNHDDQLFAPIEKQQIDFDNDEHLFLLAYRAVLKVLHTKMKATNDIIAISNKMIEKDPRLDCKPVNDINALSISSSYEFYRYKNFYDNVLLDQSFSDIRHRVFSYEHDRPTVAVNSVYSPVTKSDLTEHPCIMPCITLNVLPYKNKTIVIFSFIASQQTFFYRHFEEIQRAGNNTYYQKYLISKIILTNCENIVFSPDYYDEMSEEKRKAIIKYFKDTIIDRSQSFDDEKLCLF